MSGIARRAFLPQVNRLNLPLVKRLDQRFACERRMIAHGLRYTLHSDAWVRLTPIERFDLALQTAVLELGLTPAEALRACTSTGAGAVGRPGRRGVGAGERAGGVVAAGKRADLVVVEGNRLEDVSCVGQVRAVLQAGRWVSL